MKEQNDEYGTFYEEFKNYYTFVLESIIITAFEYFFKLEDDNLKNIVLRINLNIFSEKWENLETNDINNYDYILNLIKSDEFEENARIRHESQKSIEDQIEYKLTYLETPFPQNFYGALCLKELCDNKGIDLNNLDPTMDERINHVLQQLSNIKKRRGTTIKNNNDISEQHENELEKTYKKVLDETKKHFDQLIIEVKDNAKLNDKEKNEKINQLKQQSQKTKLELETKLFEKEAEITRNNAQFQSDMLNKELQDNKIKELQKQLDNLQDKTVNKSEYIKLQEAQNILQQENLKLEQKIQKKENELQEAKTNLQEAQKEAKDAAAKAAAAALSTPTPIPAQKRKSSTVSVKKSTGTSFDVQEKIAEILYYICIISKIVQNDNDVLNKVFKNEIKGNNYYKTADSAVIERCKDTLKNNTDKVKGIYKRIKNHYELMKGPVRVYLKIKPRVKNTDGNDQILDSSGDNEFQIKTLNNCKSKISNIDSVNEQIKDMVDPTNIHTFSKIYKPNSTSKDIFDDSIKSIIDNIIPLNGNTNIMAYGPSGSGKTYNLIGQDFNAQKPVYGIIYKVLTYLTSEYNKKEDTDKIQSIELDSWQYYMICGNNLVKQKNKDTYKCKKFRSLKAFNTDIIDSIKNKNKSLTDFYEDLHKFFNETEQIYEDGNFVKKYKNQNNFTYKYMRDPDTGPVPIQEKGVEKFKEATFDVDSIAKVQKYLKSGLDENFVTKYITQKSYDIDKGLCENIHPNDFDKWININKSKKLGYDKNSNTYKIDRSIFYEKDFTIKTINDIKDKKFNTLNILEIPDYLKQTLVGTAILTKDGEIFLNVEAKIFLGFCKRFYEYGRLTITTFDKLINRATTQTFDTDIKLDLKNESEESITNIFTKFYIALTHCRPTRATINNPDSSRSHLVINIKVNKENNKSSNFKFIDLAGNEVADENYFVMREEGNGITGSLIAIKELLKAKQDGKDEDEFNKKNLSDNDMKTYFSACVSDNQKKTCKKMYEECLNNFELKLKDTNEKLVDLNQQLTTVSMYLNLPSYLKRENYTNQCIGIADSLYFIKDLQEKTKISGIIEKYKNGDCKNYFDEWEEEKEEKAKKTQTNVFGKKRKRRKNVKSKSKCPLKSAKAFRLGTKRRGKDGKMWYVGRTKTGTRRWKKVSSLKQKRKKKLLNIIKIKSKLIH